MDNKNKLGVATLGHELLPTNECTFYYLIFSCHNKVSTAGDLG
jgi:hypothetical protein